MAIDSTKRVIHRFIREISAYEFGGELYSQIIPLDTQAYAIYPNEEGNRFFYVIGDGEHTYTEIRDGKGNGEAYKEYPVFTKGNLDIVVSGVEQETAERKAADELLQFQIDNEKLTREQIDEYLQQQIDDNDESISEIQRNLTKEVFERKQAVEEERVARTNSDESLTVKLNKEIEERKHFDELLDEALGEEIQNREDAITQLFNELKTDINNHVNDKENPHQVTKAQIGLGNVDNVSDLDKPISIATQKAIDEINVLLSNEETRATSKENELESAIANEVLRATQAEELLSDTKLNKISDANKVYGTDSQGNQIEYDIDSFGKVDDIKINDISIVSDKIANLGTMATEDSSNYTTTSDLQEGYVAKETGKGLSTNDYTTAEKEKLAGLSNYDDTELSSRVSDLENAGYQTSEQVESAISNELKDYTTTSDLNTLLEAKANVSDLGTMSAENASDYYTSEETNTAIATAINDMATQTWVGEQLGDYTTTLDLQAGYVAKESGKGLSTNDYSNTDKEKVDSLGTMSTKSAADYSTKIVADTLYADKSIEQALSTEITNRENADINLQSQIDAITASSDVTDIVGSYADLEDYDTTSLAPNSIIKVLQDENRNNETTYYRWIVEENVGHWFLIGEEGPYYTKSEADSKFVSQERTINGKALSSNITLSASDVGADSSGSAAIAEQNAKDYTDSLASNYATAAQGQLADTAVQPDDLATVATSGNYNDLSNLPEIPSAQIQSDWNQTDNRALDYIKNKPIIPSEVIIDQTYNSDSTHAQSGTAVAQAISGKQDVLTSGSNITIENGVISATDTTYTAGVGISIENGVISNTQTSAEWGNITGTLSEQTDLKNILDTKVDKSSLATVATSGSYDDLINKPTIPTDTSDLTNGAGFVTSSDLDGYATETWVDQQGYITGITNEDVTTALGYTPYSDSNPNGYTSNIGTVTAVNDILPDQNGNVNISVPSIIIRDWSTNNNK